MLVVTELVLEVKIVNGLSQQNEELITNLLESSIMRFFRLQMQFNAYWLTLYAH